MIETLLQEHREMDALADAILVQVDRAEPDMRELGRLRSALASGLKKHLALEEAAVFQPLSRQPSLARDLPVDEIKAEIRALRLIYSAHVGTWNGDAIGTDLPSYRRALHDLVARMRHLQAREERELYRPARDALAPPGLAA